MSPEALPQETHQLLVERTQQPLATQVEVARSWRARMIGLLGREALPTGQALVIPRCDSIHTVGMRFPIDAIFVDQHWRVVKILSALRPGRVPLPAWRAWAVVEMAVGSAAQAGLRVGDRLLMR